jgi:hypothetical protein
MRKHVSTGKSTSYYLDLSAWGDHEEGREEDISWYWLTK